jgi:hypothetical protein
MECVLCREPVTNPVCHECLAEAIAQWVAEKVPERIEDFWRETRALDGAHGVRCVHCRSPVGVCTYCYTREIFNWLRDGKLQFSFVEYFNFDFYREQPYLDGGHIEH